MIAQKAQDLQKEQHKDYLWNFGRSLTRSFGRRIRPRFMVLDFVGNYWWCTSLVAIGCIGEWYLFKHPASPGQESQHRTYELQFISAVAVGVTMELASVAHSIPEAIRLQRDITQLVQWNLVLATELVNTKSEQEKTSRSRISPPTQEFNLDFVPRHARLLGGSVNILVNGKIPRPFEIMPTTNGGPFYATNAVH